MGGEKKLTRREFLKSGMMAGIGLGIGLVGCSRTSEEADPIAAIERKQILQPEAMFYKLLPGKNVMCQVCFRNCVVKEGKLGFCYNKKNIGGKLYSLIYGKPCALQVDPIEKEPAFHMLPGATIFCTGTAMCNYRCKFCQNWEFAQKTMWEVINLDASPEDVVGMAIEKGCDAVSFTYNDPIVFYEFMFDIAKLAKKRGLRTLFHTNGSLNPKPLFALLEVMDAVTIDLKGFTNEFYRRVCSSELEPVLRALENIRKTDTHLEIVNLVVPTKNDEMEDIRRMCRWIKENLGREVPLHFIRFFPAYKLQRLPPTPVEKLEKAAQVADDEGLHYVYIGNVPGHERNSTFCPKCGKKIIERVHFYVIALDIKNGRCRFCGHVIPGIWWD
ncbi:MAG TPA: AmmeMemoRadiSam system radical SAM enzyme [Candidatus Latescibacteria bacterium]|nr:AmmeMemoRadiSam system radical SAM enzyme [Candidatus Latescibacterota bacterium]